MTPPRRSSSAAPRRRHSTPFSTRPAIQHNCRRCHEVLSSPTDYCWTCGARAAGIRWSRLAFRLFLVAIPAALAALAWSILAR